MTLATLRGVSRRYGAVLALADVDLDIPAEGRTAIVGPSGSGKTTLLRMIAGFERPDTGSIAVAGAILADDATFVPAHRRGIGYVAQDGALFPYLSVAQNIGYAIAWRDPQRQARIAELLDLVELDRGLATRRPHELSGGQQQRVALARSLALKPRLILLDEPFSALDAGLRDSLRNAVVAVLAAANVSTVLVTHDQAEALSFATHLAVLREGRLVQAGPPQELYLSPRDPATAAFLGDAIILDAEVRDGHAACVLGRVAVAPDAGAGRRKILIRPEQLLIAPEAAAGDAATAVVIDATFGGATTALCLRWEGSDAMPAVTFPARVPALSGIKPGDRLSVRISGTAHVFPTIT